MNAIEMLRAREAIIARLHPLGAAGSSALIADLDALLRATPEVGACEPRSLCAAVYALARTGLGVGDGHAHIIPRQGAATLQISAPGMIELARRYGGATRVATGVIRENDRYDYQLGSEPYIRHSPALRDRGEPLAAWASIHTAESTHPVIEIAMWDEIEIVRRKSKSPAWRDWPEQMAIRLPLRRAAKRLQTTPAMRAAMELDGVAEGGDAAQHTAAVRAAIESAESQTEQPQPQPQPEKEQEQ